MEQSKENAPRSYSQPSRKSKRSWRKNIDLDSLHDGLESTRDDIIQTGGQVLAEVPSSLLFETDTTGSSAIRSDYLKKNPKPLKADQILAARSAIPAVQSKKRDANHLDSGNTRTTNGIVNTRQRKHSGVSSRELERLKYVAYGGETAHKDVIALAIHAAHDPWAPTTETPADNTNDFLETTLPKRTPSTIKEPPISQLSDNKVLPNIPKPHAGRSYNPSFQDWDKLISAAGAKELQDEKRRIIDADLEKQRLERVAMAAAEAERAEAEKENEALTEHESEWEGLESEAEKNESRHRQSRRKTPAERNKVKRRKEAASLVRHESRMKQKDVQLKHPREIQAEIDSRKSVEGLPATALKSEVDLALSDDDLNVTLRRRQLGKIALSDAPLDLILAEELQDSLRRLRPEGNLLNDRFRSLVMQGKFEARKMITQPKKAKRKATEKWSYKDFRIPK